jgi:hypothetical protein
MVSMLYSYCRRLIPLSLGITLSGWSAAGLAAPASVALPDASTEAEPAQVESEAREDVELSIAQNESAPSEADTLGLEPGEAAVPLSADELRSASTSSSEFAPPQSDRPTDEGFDTPPDYLSPAANPLLLPTRPDEVEIVGTQPLSLETAIDLAYRNSETLRIALLQLERSQAGLRAQEATLLPTVDLNADLQTSNQTSAGGATEVVNTIIGGDIRASYDLGLSGERSARIRAAERQVRVSELQVEQTREQLRLDTTSDYYNVQDAIEQIRINQAFLDAADRNLRDTQLREEVGSWYPIRRSAGRGSGGQCSPSPDPVHEPAADYPTAAGAAAQSTAFDRSHDASGRYCGSLAPLPRGEYRAGLPKSSRT